jgi:hypothetical protein
MNQINFTCYIFNNVGNIFLRTEERMVKLPANFVEAKAPIGGLTVHSKYVGDDLSSNEEVYLAETIDEISVLIYGKVKILFSSFGAVKNVTSPAVAIANMTAWLNAMEYADNNNARLVIDGSYYIQKPSTTIDLTVSNIDILGDSIDSSLLFINRGGTLFTLPSEMGVFKIDGVSIKNQTGGNLLLVNSSGTAIEYPTIQNCTFDGPLTIRIHQPADATETRGFNQALIANNTFNNIGMTFFVFTNTTYDQMIVRKNRVENMLYSFMINDISNDPLSDDIREKQRMLIYEDNTVVNGPDVFAGELIGSYYVFIQTLGRECIYRRNHVEGLKSKLPLAIYDIYMSTSYGTYEDNVYKNNLCFAAVTDTGTKACFKAKSGTARKVCQRSQFIIEEDFVRGIIAADPSLDIANAWISTLSISTDTIGESELIVRDNLFDVFHLRHNVTGGGGSVYLLRQLSFINNTWRVNKVDGDGWIWLRQQDPIGVDRTLTFENNRIIKYGSESFILPAFIRGNGVYTPGVSDRKFISFKNNVIEGWSSSFTMLNFITVQEWDYQNNVVLNNNGNTTGFTEIGGSAVIDD